MTSAFIADLRGNNSSCPLCASRLKLFVHSVVHFRRAAAGAPTMLAYHLALVAAYMGLKRYERAEHALREAQRLAPDDPKVQELAELIANRKLATTGPA